MEIGIREPCPDCKGTGIFENHIGTVQCPECEDGFIIKWVEAEVKSIPIWKGGVKVGVRKYIEFTELNK